MLSRCFYTYFSIFTVIFFVSVNCQAQGLEINLGDEIIQARYSTNAGGSNYGRSELTYGVLHNTEININLVEIGLLVIDVAGTKAPGLEVGIGPKLYFIKDRGVKTSAIGLGGSLNYKLDQSSRIYIAAKAFYAPSVVSFIDADSMYEISVELGFEVLKNAEIYIGRRDIEVDYLLKVDNKIGGKIDDTSYFGMRLRF